MNTARAKHIQRALLSWYGAHARVLPWRDQDDPYAVWISEIMAQQTRIATVIPYFERWMAAFPTVTDLAEAPLDAVLLQWQGLGYYSRARNLHRAAQIVASAHAGRIPERFEDLQALPGIGTYTAGAIASIAFGAQVPAIDGNVIRVLTRLERIEGDVSRAATKREIHVAAHALAQTDVPGDLNQALMELGATICTPTKPKCTPEGLCPIAKHCRGMDAAQAGALPNKPAKAKPRRERRVYVFAFDSDGRFELTQETDRQLLGQLWIVPSFSTLAEAQRAYGEPLQTLEPVVHKFTHIHLSATPAIVNTRQLAAEGPHRRNLTLAALHEVACSKLMLKLADAVRETQDISPR